MKEIYKTLVTNKDKLNEIKGLLTQLEANLYKAKALLKEVTGK